MMQAPFSRHRPSVPLRLLADRMRRFDQCPVSREVLGSSQDAYFSRDCALLNFLSSPFLRGSPQTTPLFLFYPSFFFNQQNSHLSFWYLAFVLLLYPLASPLAVNKGEYSPPLRHRAAASSSLLRIPALKLAISTRPWNRTCCTMMSSNPPNLSRPTYNALVAFPQ